MSRLGAVLTGLGVLIVVSRGPLLLAPEATLGVYRKLIQTTGRGRALGLGILLFGLALVLAVRTEPGPAARVIEGLGWLMAAPGVGLAAFPRPAQRFLDSIFSAVSDTGILRATGALAVAVGFVLIYLGVSGF